MQLFMILHAAGVKMKKWVCKNVEKIVGFGVVALMVKMMLFDIDLNIKIGELMYMKEINILVNVVETLLED